MVAVSQLNSELTQLNSTELSQVNLNHQNKTSKPRKKRNTEKNTLPSSILFLSPFPSFQFHCLLYMYYNQLLHHLFISYSFLVRIHCFAWFVTPKITYANAVCVSLCNLW